MPKAGRNDLCPCGSGKKYKYCHLKTGSSLNGRQEQKLPEAPLARTFAELIKNYNSHQILKILGVLQLQPANHKKYLRLEQMARLTLIELRNPQGHKLYAYWDLLKNAINSFTEYNYLEDDPPTLFTENVVFHQGNYVVYPGFNVTSTKILNELFECIFLVQNSLNKSFKDSVSNAAGLLLFLSNQSADYLKHNRFIEDSGFEEDLVFPEHADIFNFLEAISFSDDYLKKNAEHYKFDLNILEEFIIDPKNERLLIEDPDENPAVLFPLIREEGEVIVYLISGIIPSITNYIYRKAEEHKETESLNKIMTERQFEKVVIGLQHNGWQELNFKFPELSSPLSIQETIFQFDMQKLTYLCFIDPKRHKTVSHDEVIQYDAYRHRNDEVIEALTSKFSKHPVEILTLYVFAETGSDFFFAWPKSPGNHLSLPISYNELDAICYSDNTNSLTLWQFAKVYCRTLEFYKISAAGGTLDAYVAYMNNAGSFLHKTQGLVKGGQIFIPVGYSNDFLTASLRKRDEHAVALLYERQKAFTKVIRYKPYSPIYLQKENIQSQRDFFRLVIENFKMPIWITAQVKNNEWARFVCEGVGYWLNKMAPALSSFFSTLTFLQFELKFIIDEALQQKVRFDTFENNSGEVHLDIKIVAPVIEISVPFSFLNLVQRRDNLADRTLMRAVLDGFNAYFLEAKEKVLLKEEDIKTILDGTINPPTAKMFLFTDTSNNLRHDNVDLPPLRVINDAATSYIQENLIDFFPGRAIPENIEDTKDKIKVCNTIVAKLNTQIADKLESYDGILLMKELIRINERIINVRARKEVLIPAKISSYSSFDNEVDEITDGENLAATNQALRILIEYVAVKIPNGNKWPNNDEIEELLALVTQVLFWGDLSDGIDKGLQNPSMGLYPSGRIKVENTDEDVYLGHLYKAQTTSEIFRYVEASNKNEAENNSFFSKEKRSDFDALDKAFTIEFGLSVTDLTKIAYILSHAGSQRNTSCLNLKEEELISLILTADNGVTQETILLALNLLSLVGRKGINQPSPGLPIHEIYPWRHKRSIAFLRRPLVRYKMEQDVYYMFGFRHMTVFLENLYSLLYESKLPNPKSPEMVSWLGARSHGKGNPFRQEVYEWLCKTLLHVEPNEIDIKDKGPLVADRDYGDIDILAFDHTDKIIYSIECKNITGAKTKYEMWSEVENYIGDGVSDDAKIIRHLKRHHWLQENKIQLKQYAPEVEDYKVVSFVMSVDEIPLAYLKQVSLPLPIRSFVFLRKNKLEYLKELYSV